MKPLIPLLSLVITACVLPETPNISVSGFSTDGDSTRTSTSPTTPDLPPAVLKCPGETQCPCEISAADTSGGTSLPFYYCPEELYCGPAIACTLDCMDDSQCTSGVSGEACVGGRCAVLCDPAKPLGGCKDAGMPGASCSLVLGAYVCGYGD